MVKACGRTCRRNSPQQRIAGIGLCVHAIADQRNDLLHLPYPIRTRQTVFPPSIALLTAIHVHAPLTRHRSFSDCIISRLLTAVVVEKGFTDELLSHRVFNGCCDPGESTWHSTNLKRL